MSNQPSTLQADAHANQKKGATITDQELRITRLAEQLGITIADDHYRALHPHDLGGWFPTQRLILIAPDQSWADRLHTMAHELGHALHDHPAGHHPKHERVADEFAASLLIDPHAYIEAEQLYGEHTGAIAHELGVTVALVETWRSLYERIIS